MGIRSLILVLAIGCSSSGADDATFVAWGSSTSSITLAWLPVDGATGYQLDRDGRDPVMLPADALQYLDSGLAEGSYTYHLTALGVTAPVEATKAKTSVDRAVVTTDDAPIGAPAVGELPMARAVAADGTSITLQQIVAPTGESDAAIAISSDTAPAAAVDLAFALDDDDLADPNNVAVAAKQPDGTWVSVGARLDGDRVVATLPPETHQAFAAPGSWQRKFVKFRRIRIKPNPINVRANSVVAVVAQKVYSDDVCETETPTWCRLANGGQGFNDALMPLPRPIVETRRVQNKTGTWRVDGPGTIEGAPDEFAITYKAPSSKPSQSRWSISFTTKGATPMTASAVVQFLENKFQLQFHYDHQFDEIGTDLQGDVTDVVFFTIDASPDGPITIVDGPYNEDSVVKNPSPALAGTTVMQTSPFELVTAKTVDIGGSGTLAVDFHGTTTLASTTVTFMGGGTQAFPSPGAQPSNLSLQFPGVDFATITTAKSFDAAGTAWRLDVTPIEPL